jgi:hypothetical protein
MRLRGPAFSSRDTSLDKAAFVSWCPYSDHDIVSCYRKKADGIRGRDYLGLTVERHPVVNTREEPRPISKTLITPFIACARRGSAVRSGSQRQRMSGPVSVG